MTARTPWPEQAWTAIDGAATDLHALTAALQGLRAACSTAAAALTPASQFHPAAGWLTADGLLALLELTATTGPTPETNVDEPSDLQTAADAIELLLQQAADLAHTIAADATAAGDRDRSRVIADVVKQLALGHQLTYGRPW